MSEHGGLGYSAVKIFIVLFILTALEVFWGMAMRDFGRFVLWGGLMAFAIAKAMLILMYFMHMKYEKMIVWGLIIPTPLLVAVVLFALMPDISFNDEQLDRPIGYMFDYESGEVEGISTTDSHGEGDHDGDSEDHGADAGGH